MTKNVKNTFQNKRERYYMSKFPSPNLYLRNIESTLCLVSKDSSKPQTLTQTAEVSWFNITIHLLSRSDWKIKIRAKILNCHRLDCKFHSVIPVPELSKSTAPIPVSSSSSLSSSPLTSSFSRPSLAICSASSLSSRSLTWTNEHYCMRNMMREREREKGEFQRRLTGQELCKEKN